VALAVAICLMPEAWVKLYVFKASFLSTSDLIFYFFCSVQREYFPYDWQILQEAEKEERRNMTHVHSDDSFELVGIPKSQPTGEKKEKVNKRDRKSIELP
jgi:hypothetical protein